MKALSTELNGKRTWQEAKGLGAGNTRTVD
jgi:hypothetical protein